MSRPLNRNPETASWTRRFLGGLQTVFMLTGLLALGYYGWAKTEAFLFQRYESWRLVQLQQGRPATVGLFVDSLLPGRHEGNAASDLKDGGRGPSSRLSGAEMQDRDGGGPGQSPFQSAAPDHSEGTLIGRIEIPRLKLSAIVLEGTQAKTLQLAVGHITGTPLPGESGSVELAAHRDSFFRGLRNIQKGDEVELSGVNGLKYDYQVDSLMIIPPDEGSILRTSTDPGVDLITCYPFNYVGPAPKRFVVHASQVKMSYAPIERTQMSGNLNSTAGQLPSVEKAGFVALPNHTFNPSPKRILRASQHVSRTAAPSGSKLTTSSSSFRNVQAPDSASKDFGSSEVSAGATSSRHSSLKGIGSFFRKVIHLGNSAKPADKRGDASGN